MKQLFFAFLAISFALCTSAQVSDTARMHPFKQYVPQPELDKFNLRQTQINKCGLYALSAWGLGNVLYGSIAGAKTHGEAQFFHVSNAIWGSVNLVIGLPGVISSYNKSRAMNMSYGKTVLQQHGAEKLYLINGALDFAYIGGGAAMWGFSDRINNTKTRTGFSGVGKSFMVQGAFLLVFDWSMYLVHTQHAHKDLNRYTSGLSFTGTSLSYELMF